MLLSSAPGEGLRHDLEAGPLREGPDVAEAVDADLATDGLLEGADPAVAVDAHLDGARLGPGDELVPAKAELGGANGHGRANESLGEALVNKFY